MTLKYCSYVARLSPPRLLLALAAASAAILGTALVAQYGFDLHPCELCLYQRYPYGVVILLGILGYLAVKSEKILRLLLLLCGLLLVADGGIATYHAGVEKGVFPGPSACSSSASSGESLEEMRAAILNAPLVPCNQPMASFLGLSMAAWNALAAFGLALAAFAALCGRKREI